MYSYHYLVLIINASQEILDHTPVVKHRIHKIKGRTYQSYYFRDAATNKIREYAEQTPRGQKLKAVFEMRKKAEMKLNQHLDAWITCFKYPCPRIDLSKLRQKAQSAVITKEVYDSLVPLSNKHPVTNPNPYKGITFRSKSEREMAEYLDSVGIEYKYEPLMHIGADNIVIYPDFVCYISELGFGFVIEHFGMLDSPDYFDRMMRALRMYLGAGYVPGNDILFTYERSTCPPRKNYFESQINRMLDNLCAA